MYSKKILFMLFSSLFLTVFAFGADHSAGAIAHSGSLHPSDFVGVSFWLATAIMLAATVFFFVERDFIARLEAAPPTAILWPLHPFDHMESRSIQDIAPLVVAWVEARYRPDQETAKFRLWLPRRTL